MLGLVVLMDYWLVNFDHVQVMFVKVVLMDVVAVEVVLEKR